MKAAVLYQQNKPLVLENLIVPNPVGHQILVKIHRSGLCGAQINEILGTKGSDPYLPHLLGHEGSGTVEKVGDQVKKVKNGDQVVLHWRKGSGGEGPFPRYKSASGFHIGGGHVTTFAELALISENRVTKIDKTIPHEIACLFGCCVSTGFGIVFNELKLRKKSTIAVIGCGGVGLNVIYFSKMKDASFILGVDKKNRGKAEIAKLLGAHLYKDTNGPSDIFKVLMEDCAGGFDAIVDTTGNCELISSCFECLNKNGTLVLTGQPKKAESLEIKSALDLFTGKKILVSQGGLFEPDRDILKLQKIYNNDKSSFGTLISSRFSLEKINDAVQSLINGVDGRIIIEINN